MEKLYAVFIDSYQYYRPVISKNLSGTRLVEDVIIPYENNDVFVLDGVWLKREELKRIKIVLQLNDFIASIENLQDEYLKARYETVGLDRQNSNFDAQSWVNREESSLSRYYFLMELIFDRHGKDVTSQMLKPSNYQERVRIIQRLLGRWTYFAQNTSDKSHNVFKHDGKCIISNDSGKISIKGKRNSSSSHGDGEWVSHWADICEDEVFRFSYKINLGKIANVESFAEIKINKENLDRLQGSLFFSLSIPLKAEIIFEKSN